MPHFETATAGPGATQRARPPKPTQPKTNWRSEIGKIVARTVKRGYTTPTDEKALAYARAKLAAED